MSRLTPSEATTPALVLAAIGVATAGGFVWLVVANLAVLACLAWGCECWLGMILVAPILFVIGVVWVELARQGLALPRLPGAVEGALVAGLAALPVSVGVAAGLRWAGVVGRSAPSITDHALACTLGGVAALAVIAGRAARRA